MNKDKKVTCKKSLVRNTVKSVPKVNIHREVSESASLRTNSTNYKKPTDIPSTSTGITDKETVSFDIPQLNSTKKFVQAMDDIVKPSKSKSKSCSDVDVDLQGLTLDDKISAKVNFPPHKSIYKGLIPLETTESEITVKSKTGAVRRPRYTPEMDIPEPNLADLIEPEETEDYICYSDVKRIESEPTITFGDSLRLYKIYQMSREDNF